MASANYDPWTGWKSKKAKEEEKREEKKSPEEESKKNAEKIAKTLSEVEDKRKKYFEAIDKFKIIPIASPPQRYQLEAKLYIEQLGGDLIPGYISLTELAHLTQSTYLYRKAGTYEEFAPWEEGYWDAWKEFVIKGERLKRAESMVKEAREQEPLHGWSKPYKEFWVYDPSFATKDIFVPLPLAAKLLREAIEKEEKICEKCRKALDYTLYRDKEGNPVKLEYFFKDMLEHLADLFEKVERGEHPVINKLEKYNLDDPKKFQSVREVLKEARKQQVIFEKVLTSLGIFHYFNLITDNYFKRVLANQDDLFQWLKWKGYVDEVPGMINEYTSQIMHKLKLLGNQLEWLEKELKAHIELYGGGRCP